MKIGFCGLGRLGTAMVLRLLKAGHEVRVWNRTVAKSAPVIAEGAKLAASPAALADASELVLLCLFDAIAVEAVVFGPEGIATSLHPRWVVDHSSISPEATRRFVQRLAKMGRADWIDAPVSGGVVAAQAGALTIMAGGQATATAELTGVFGAYAARVMHVGEWGAGQTAKLCNQTIVAANLLAIGEAVALARDSGLDPATLPDVFAGGWADSKLLQLIIPRMLSRPADTIGTLAALFKDVEEISALARERQTPMPVSAAVQQTLRLAVGKGAGDLDISRLSRFLGKPEASR